MSKSVLAQAEALVAGYVSVLAERGIIGTVRLQYFESKVFDKYTYTCASSILDDAERKRLDRNEAKHYFDQPNRFYCLVLTLSPLDRSLVPKRFCREYAFVIRKIYRFHRGEAPKERVTDEVQVLAKLKRRLEAVVSAPAGRSPTDLCRDRLIDGMRYVFSEAYGYRKQILGKDANIIRFWTELLVAAVFLVVVPLIDLLFRLL